MRALGARLTLTYQPDQDEPAQTTSVAFTVRPLAAGLPVLPVGVGSVWPLWPSPPHGGHAGAICWERPDERRGNDQRPCAAGRVITKRAPWPGPWLSAWMLPPWAWTIARVMVRPMPLPPAPGVWVRARSTR